MRKYSKKDVMHDIEAEMKCSFLKSNTYKRRDVLLRNIAVTLFCHNVFGKTWNPCWSSSGHELANQLGLQLKCNSNGISLHLGRFANETIVLGNF